MNDTPVDSCKHAKGWKNTKIYGVCILKCLKKVLLFVFVFKGRGGRGGETYAISVICFSNFRAPSRKIIPSFEPTVLKYPAEKPPLNAPWNRLYLPFSSLTVWSWRGIGFFGLSPEKNISGEREGDGGLEKLQTKCHFLNIMNCSLLVISNITIF